MAIDDEDLIPVDDKHVEDLVADEGGQNDDVSFIDLVADEGWQDDDISFMDDEVLDADVEEGFDLDDVMGDVMDGWDDLVAADEAVPDEAQDDQNEIKFDDYIPDDP